MSYGIMAFSVSVEQVQRAFGSKDTGLAESIKRQFADAFEQDEVEKKVSKDEGYDEALSLGQALADIIEGKELQTGNNNGSSYGTILEMLCHHFGGFLPNGEFSGMRVQWAETIEEALAAAGIPKDQFSLLNHLMYRSSPVRIPEPDDFPFIGYLKLPEIIVALHAVEAANLSSLDREQQKAVVQLQGWLEACATAQTDLVCFYH